ncbi:MAG: lysylphosphatidylglycerol synthase transmembrane domain-containing protein [Planctomycetota bacterium]|nr:lysylphosphatidylglycerol synthase transmembrane domain-containing protein [Planctomycetota bacterium]
MNKFQFTVLKFGFAIGIVGFLVYKASSSDQFQSIVQSEKQWGFLWAGQVLVTAGISLSFIRWRRLVQAVGIPFSYLDCLRIGFVGHMFGSVSIGTFGADAVRIYFVSRENPDHKALALVTVFVDRVCGLLGLFMLTTLTMFAFRYFGDSAILMSDLGTLQAITWIALGLTCTGLIGFSGLFVFPHVKNTKGFRRLVQLRWIGPLLEKALEAGIVYQQRPQVLVLALLQSIGVHVLLTLSVFCVAVGLRVEHPSLGDHFIISPISHLASVLPLPGGIGGLEGFLWFFYRSIGDQSVNTTGLIVALAYRIETLVVAVVGVLFYLKGRQQIDELVDQHREEQA